MQLNISDYLKRIQMNEQPAPTLSSLFQLQKAHLFNIPFENLDIHYGNRIELDFEKIYDKIVVRKRGGFCYELNGLFYQLLVALGYQTKMVSGRVFNKKRVLGQEFDHLAIIVNIEGKDYLTEVGFGAFSLFPLEIKMDKWQEDPTGRYMINQDIGDYLRVNTEENGEPLGSYIFSLESRSFHEFGDMCIYQQLHPDSHFLQKKIITRPTEEGRISLTGNVLKITTGGDSEYEKLLDEAAFEAALLEYFGIEVAELI